MQPFVIGKANSGYVCTESFSPGGPTGRGGGLLTGGSIDEGATGEVRSAAERACYLTGGFGVWPPLVATPSQDHMYMKEARKMPGIKVVSPAWLWACAERWQWADETMFPPCFEHHVKPHLQLPMSVIKVFQVHFQWLIQVISAIVLPVNLALLDI